MKLRPKIWLQNLLVLAFVLYSGNLMAESIKVAAAANVQNALIEITEIFKSRYGIQVDLIFAASGKISAQIINGAPFDIFISADHKYPVSLYVKKFAKEPRVYALGTLIIWTTRPLIYNGNFDQSLVNLKHKGISKISIPNPEIAPYGRAALYAIKHIPFSDAILKKLVYTESVTQSNQYIQTGTVEAGFTSFSSVLDPAIKNPGRYWIVDANLYPPIEQSACILEYGIKHHPKESEKYFNFLFSTEAQKIFKKYGYKF